MKLMRDLQYKILNLASEEYPSSISPGYNNDLDTYDENILAANLKYLEEHELISPNSVIVSIDNMYSFSSFKITKDGLDFLLGDDGLSAILGVVTVKFEAEQLKAILESRIMASDLPTPDKNKLISGLQSLSAESIKHLTMKILDSGWDNLGQLIHSIQSNLF
ncbi:hypothetical protein [Acinetobacter pollinis]|uniref:hypothetical protein n=1 Tax=Acinetobacter pollinis TaxID=2605270 RepID=UPI0018C288C1|nr:hypothetical protein [Acinetobacter pollinis]MBF7694051.1 hypothetical protein [Acinetobacter pollinis]MBF7701680.1 hypothetical protein [Acinetobacter pollinis]